MATIRIKIKRTAPVVRIKIKVKRVEPTKQKQEEEDEALKEKNERLAFKGLEATECEKCGCYCEKVLGSDDDICGSCEEEPRISCCALCKEDYPWEGYGENVILGECGKCWNDVCGHCAHYDDEDGVVVCKRCEDK